MRRTLISLLGILFLAAGCVSKQVNQAYDGQEAIQDAREAVEETNKSICIQCGDGCIPASLAPLTQCPASSKEIECVMQDSQCQPA